MPVHTTGNCTYPMDFILKFSLSNSVITIFCEEKKKHGTCISYNYLLTLFPKFKNLYRHTFHQFEF